MAERPEVIDINNPDHANLVVSPDNLHTDPVPAEVDPDKPNE